MLDLGLTMKRDRTRGEIFAFTGTKYFTEERNLGSTKAKTEPVRETSYSSVLLRNVISSGVPTSKPFLLLTDSALLFLHAWLVIKGFGQP